MPQFMDYHAKLPDLPAEAVQQVKQAIEAGAANEFGAKPVNIYFGTEGQACCITDAPNAEAVVKSHEAQGIPLSVDEVIEVTSVA